MSLPVLPIVPYLSLPPPSLLTPKSMRHDLRAFGMKKLNNRIVVNAYLYGGRSGQAPSQGSWLKASDLAQVVHIF